jgi:hypothetical protein
MVHIFPSQQLAIETNTCQTLAKYFMETKCSIEIHDDFLISSSTLQREVKKLNKMHAFKFHSIIKNSKSSARTNSSFKLRNGFKSKSIFQ